MSIKFENLSHTYSPDTPFKYAALKNVNLEIREGKMTAIIGQTGSGKSTLVQHLNALLLPTEGQVEVVGRVIKAGEQAKNLKSLRGQVGLVFQFPEYQLFEETVLRDVMFGPKNFGLSEEEAEKKASKALELVGLPKDCYNRSPLELSGGQKRRVAIAGILAMDPDVLVLDEPTAGLDVEGTAKMMKLFYDLNKEYHKTVLMVTHDMENVFNYCDDVVVVSNGSIETHGEVKEFFKDPNNCHKYNILPPYLIRMKEMLNEKGFNISEDVMSLDELADAIMKEVKNHG